MEGSYPPLTTGSLRSLQRTRCEAIALLATVVAAREFHELAVSLKRAASHLSVSTSFRVHHGRIMEGRPAWR